MHGRRILALRKNVNTKSGDSCARPINTDGDIFRRVAPPSGAAAEKAVLNELDALRWERRMAKSEIDKKLGRSKGYFGHLLSGNLGATVERIVSVLEILEVEPGDFFGRVFSPAPAEGQIGEAVEEAFESLDLPGVASLDAISKIVDRRIESHLERFRDELDQVLERQAKSSKK